MDTVKLSEEPQNLKEATDGLQTPSNALHCYDIKKEVDEIAFDLHHSIDIKEENFVVEPELYGETEAQINFLKRSPTAVDRTQPRKRASSYQTSVLLDLIEKNENIRLGKGTADALNAEWQFLAQELNAVGGATKTAEKWRKGFTEWKSHVRIKLRKGETLSAQDRRCAKLAGIGRGHLDNSTVSELDFSEERKNRGKMEKATAEQLSSLLDFMQQNEDFRLSKGTAHDLKESWEDLALQVNSVGGSIKTVKGWKKVYVDWKSRVRLKLKNRETLSEQDKRCAYLAGLNTADIGQLRVDTVNPNKSTVGELDFLDEQVKIETTSRGKRATSDQMSSLLDFIQQHDDFRLSKGTTSDLKAGWEALTQQVNAIGGTTKTAEGWKKAYTEWKSHVRIKLKRGDTLSEQDKRCAHLAGLESTAGEIDFSDKREAITKTSRHVIATSEHMLSLLDFIQRNDNFRLGRESADNVKADWEALTREVNSVDGSCKTVKGWKKAYIEWKSDVRMKLSKGETLSEQDQRYAHLARLNTVGLSKSAVRDLGFPDKQKNRERIKKSYPGKRATSEQLSSLLDFIQENENLRLGKGTMANLKAGWEALAHQVNAVGGTTKKVEGWKKAYTEWKSHVRIKIKKGQALSELNKRCALVAGLNTINLGKSPVRKTNYPVKQEPKEKTGKLSRGKRATLDQMSALLDYIEENEDFRLKKGSVDDLNAGWDALTFKVNAVGGAIKPAEGWKWRYTEWKSHIRTKLKKGEPLSKLDRRCVQLARLDTVNPRKFDVSEEQVENASCDKKATSQQMSSLTDFIEEDGNSHADKGTVDDLNSGWETLTGQVNAVCGTTKTSEGWKRACEDLEGVDCCKSTVRKRDFPDEWQKIARKIRGKRATADQISTLLDFIEKNDNFRLGKGTEDDLKAGWEALAREVNAVGGAIKKAEGWKKAYTEWKSHVRIKLKKGETLTEQDKRCVHLAGLNRIDLGKSMVRRTGFQVERKIIVTKSRSKRATSDQMSTLLDFIQKNDNFRLGKGTPDELKAGWEALSRQVNAVGKTTKNVNGWRKAYTEWKSHIRKKLRKREALSRLEKRCAQLARLNTGGLSKLTVKERSHVDEQKKIVNRSRGKRATSDQMCSLLDFIQENDNLRLGKGTADDLIAGWEALTRQVNTMGGTIKSVEGWRKTYTEWKSHIRIKLRKGEALSELDKRCAQLAGLHISKSKELGCPDELEDGELVKRDPDHAGGEEIKCEVGEATYDYEFVDFKNVKLLQEVDEKIDEPGPSTVKRELFPNKKKRKLS